MKMILLALALFGACAPEQCRVLRPVVRQPSGEIIPVRLCQTTPRGVDRKCWNNTPGRSIAMVRLDSGRESPRFGQICRGWLCWDGVLTRYDACTLEQWSLIDGAHTITLWLPLGASDKLIEHERCHAERGGSFDAAKWCDEHESGGGDR